MQVDQVDPAKAEANAHFGWGFLCGAALSLTLCAALFAFGFLPIYRVKADAVKYAMQDISILRGELRDVRAALRFALSSSSAEPEIVSGGPLTPDEFNAMRQAKGQAPLKVPHAPMEPSDRFPAVGRAHPIPNER